MRENIFAPYLAEVGRLSKAEGERIRNSENRILEEEGILEV